MAEEKSQPKWEGSSTAEIRPFTAAQVWPLLADDFCSLHKWLPGIDTCRWVEGTPGQPGLTRYCADSSTSKWANEKLIAIDAQEMCYSYEVTDNNIGFRSYVATIRVSPLTEGAGCKVEWSFTVEPVEEWKLEDMRAFIESGLHGMARNLETALKSQETA
ncbi:lachrymatory-factor synthase [Punica granatum]|uniref:Uncharacterized protein n=2 Tax=Punica granatum TaxID=22663 RepID=A0A218XPN4_PUNGR|nr:lachrymatory-factor synthase [Punica granatum]OWM86596.1 hypothetical protein CDL15_Pgr015631 [Punica granatum]PKI67181.1 hypothetical protein CRG98_012430 [Punica granatum]